MKTQTPKTYVQNYDIVTPLGIGMLKNWEQLSAGISGIVEHQSYGQMTDVAIGQIQWDVDAAFNTAYGDSFDCTRLEKMMLLSVASIMEAFTPNERSLLMIATTKGNINALQSHTEDVSSVLIFNLAQKINKILGFRHKPRVVSNACVSGVMAVAIAKNLIEAGYYDDIVIIAADEISEFVLSGFKSFQAMSPKRCQPYDKDRKGVNLGEASAAIHLSINKNAYIDNFVICAERSINDANHISGPSRTGDGLYASIKNSLIAAGLPSSSIDYVSTHGTATIYNDEMESIALQRAGLLETPINSLKGYLGHTLGAAGLVEFNIALAQASKNILLPNLGLTTLGVTEPIHVIQKTYIKPINYFIKTASGFGGSNTAVVVEKI